MGFRASQSFSDVPLALMEGSLGPSQAMRRAVSSIENYAQRVNHFDLERSRPNHPFRAPFAPLVVLGPSGIGPEVQHLVSLLSKLLQSRQGAVVRFNCEDAALGAAEANLMLARKLEEAHGGVLHLQRLECLPERTQIMLQEYLENCTVAPSQPSCDVLCIAEASVQSVSDSKKLRQGLLDQFIPIWTIQIPPLRERPVDILPLLNHFCASYGRHLDYSFQGLEADLGDENLESLKKYPWLGESVELQRQARVLIHHASARGTNIDAHDIIEAIRNYHPDGAGGVPGPTPDPPDPPDDSQAAMIPLVTPLPAPVAAPASLDDGGAQHLTLCFDGDIHNDFRVSISRGGRTSHIYIEHPNDRKLLYMLAISRRTGSACVDFAHLCRTCGVDPSPLEAEQVRKMAQGILDGFFRRIKRLRIDHMLLVSNVRGQGRQLNPSVRIQGLASVTTSGRGDAGRADRWDEPCSHGASGRRKSSFKPGD